MRWLGFAICAILFLTLQTTVAWRFQIGQARPDWMLVLAVFFALHARSEEGLVAGCILGVLADLMSIDRFGLLTLLYGLSVWVLFKVRGYFFLDHPLTHGFLTFVPALMIGLALSVYQSWVGGIPSRGLTVSFIEVVFGAAHTGLWAVPLHRVLAKFPRLLGVRVSKGARASAGSLRARHV